MRLTSFVTLRYTVALGGLALLALVVWGVTARVETRSTAATRAELRTQAIERLILQAERFRNRVEVLSPKSADDELLTGPLVTEQWRLELERLRDASSPHQIPLADTALEQLATTDRLGRMLIKASSGGKQYAVDVVDLRTTAASYLEALGVMGQTLSSEARHRRAEAQRSRLWVIGICAGLGVVYVLTLLLHHLWERRAKGRLVLQGVSGADLEALGDEAGLLRLQQLTPDQLHQLARSMVVSHQDFKRDARERSAELEQQARDLEREVAVRRMAEEQLRYTAFHDHLTGLCNRDLLLDRLDRSTDRARRHEDYEFAVLYLDIDRFKEVNDSLGHTLGDRLLVDVARRLEDSLRTPEVLGRSECNTIARIGGDDFVVLIDGIQAPTDATSAAEGIQQVLGRPFVLDAHEVYISASIGIATSALDYESSEDLLRDADVAMYHAKDSGRARHEVFSSEMHERATQRLNLANEFRRAIERLDFTVQFQPIVDLQTMRTRGFEALARWQHPEQGLISPHEFIDHAEETGLIVKLGAWVLDQTCRQLRIWREELGLGDEFAIGVNVSKRQLIVPDLVDRVRAALDEHGLPGRCLKLEVTESAIVTCPEHLRDVLMQLKTLGVEIHMDDFGTGYSSLSQLHRLPLDLLKVDQEFMATLTGDGDNPGIIQTIVMLAHHLGMKVTVEGVENAAQVRQLEALGCDYGQGYHFSSPVGAEAARDLIMRDWSSTKTTRRAKSVKSVKSAKSGRGGKTGKSRSRAGSAGSKAA